MLAAGLAGVFTACLVGATLLLLTPVFEHMPLSALGAIVISGVIGLINCDEAVFLWRVRDVRATDVFTCSALRRSHRSNATGSLHALSVHHCHCHARRA